MMKRIISVFLTLTLILSSVAFTSIVSAADDATTGLPNVALGKSVTVATQYSKSYPPEKAVDGDELTIWADGNEVIGEKVDGKEKFVVDLGAPYKLEQVIVRSRRDVDAGTYRKGWIIEAALESDFSDTFIIGEKPTAGDFKSDFISDFSEPIIARYILVHTTATYLVISEIEAYGTKYTGEEKVSYEDTKEGNYNASQMVASLGLMEGISSKELGADYLVRREEAAKIVALAAGLNVIKTETSSFSDVAADNKYSDYIEACLKADIISKSDNFRPRDFVRGTEILKMLQTAMGYSEVLTKLGSYPTNVYELTRKLELAKGVDLVLDDYASKEDILRILYNSLLAPTVDIAAFNDNGVLYSEKKTLLKRAFGLEYLKGTVTENSITGLVSPIDAGGNSVKIDGISYYDEKNVVHELIGQSIYFLADEENAIVAAWDNRQRQTVYTASAKDIVFSQTTANSIVVATEDDEEEIYTLQNPPYVLKNGVAYDNYTKDSLNVVNGTIKLIDNNNDGMIEVINILEPKVLVLDYIKNTSGRITAGGINGESIDVSGYKYLKVRQDGQDALIDEIGKGSLLYAYVSENGESVIIDIFRNSAVGVVTELTSENIFVDGAEYGFSKYYLDNKDRQEKLVLSLNATFIFDEMNDLVWIADANFAAKPSVLAVTQHYEIPYGYENVKLLLYTENAEFKTLEIADRLIMDGTAYSQSDLKTLLENNSTYLVGKLSLYSVNAKDQISKIDTENYNPVSESNSKLIDMNISIEKGNIKATGGIYSGHNLIVPMTENFPVFMIPVNENSVPYIGKEYEKYYSVTTAENKFTKGQINFDGDFCFYGADASGNPVVAVHSFGIGEATSPIGKVSSISAENMVVDSISKITNSNGEICYGISGYNLNSGNKIKLVTASRINKVIDSYKIQQAEGNADIPENKRPTSSWFTNYHLLQSVSGLTYYTSSVENLKCGDVIRYATSGTETTCIERIYSVDDSNLSDLSGKIYSAGDNYMNILSSCRLISSEFLSYSEGVLNVDAGSGSKEVVDCDRITGSFFVCDGNKLSKYDASFVPAYAENSVRMVLLSKGGVYNTIVAYMN